MRIVRASSAALGTLAVLLGCGPSFQAIYEGDSRFEHCYALDDDPNFPMQKKADCWKDWTKNYTYGQTRDRVEYASVRYRALSRVPAAPTDEAMMGAAPGEGPQTSAVSAPMPTSAFAPPPKTLTDQDAGSSGGSWLDKLPFVRPPGTSTPATATPPSGGPAADAPSDAGSAPVPRAPNAECTDGCWATWQHCREACAAKACGACDKTYGKCVKACF